jgi:hypothetical protein
VKAPIQHTKGSRDVTGETRRRGSNLLTVKSATPVKQTATSWMGRALMIYLLSGVILGGVVAVLWPELTYRVARNQREDRRKTTWCSVTPDIDSADQRR